MEESQEPTIAKIQIEQAISEISKIIGEDS